MNLKEKFSFFISHEPHWWFQSRRYRRLLILLVRRTPILFWIPFRMARMFTRLITKDSPILFERGEIPKIIWSVWFQGESHAPGLVKHCFASWRKYNPEWEIRVLDRQNVEAYLPWKKIRSSYLPEKFLIKLARNYSYSQKVENLNVAELYSAHFIWFNYMRRILKGYPYHWSQYKFTELMLKDRKIEAIYRYIQRYQRKIKLDVSALIQFKHYIHCPLQESLRAINERAEPLYKLAHSSRRLPEKMRLLFESHDISIEGWSEADDAKKNSNLFYEHKISQAKKVPLKHRS